MPFSMLPLLLPAGVLLLHALLLVLLAVRFASQLQLVFELRFGHCSAVGATFALWSATNSRAAFAGADPSRAAALKRATRAGADARAQTDGARAAPTPSGSHSGPIGRDA